MEHDSKTYQELCRHAREAKQLESVLQLLEWDEQTKLPHAGGAYRAEQIAHLARLLHEKQTAPQVGQWLDELSSADVAGDPSGDAAAIVRLLKRDYDKKTCLPVALVEELARVRTLAQQTWVEARKSDDFALFSTSATANTRSQTRRGRGLRVRRHTLRSLARRLRAWRHCRGRRPSARPAPRRVDAARTISV